MTSVEKALEWADRKGGREEHSEGHPCVGCRFHAAPVLAAEVRRLRGELDMATASLKLLRPNLYSVVKEQEEKRVRILTLHALEVAVKQSVVVMEDLTGLAYLYSALESRLSSAERVVQTVRGFRDHGEAKNGTHAGIMFAALTHHDQEA